jgi:hypothetical protein
MAQVLKALSSSWYKWKEVETFKRWDLVKILGQWAYVFEVDSGTLDSFSVSLTSWPYEVSSFLHCAVPP